MQNMFVKFSNSEELRNHRMVAHKGHMLASDVKLFNLTYFIYQSIFYSVFSLNHGFCRF